MKTFPKKEHLLEAFPDFVAKGKMLWQNDAAFGKLLEKIAIREAKRNNDEYRPAAFRCLWRFAAARDDLNLLPDISADYTVRPVFVPIRPSIGVWELSASFIGTAPASPAGQAFLSALLTGPIERRAMRHVDD